MIDILQWAAIVALVAWRVGEALCGWWRHRRYLANMPRLLDCMAQESKARLERSKRG